MPCQESEEDLEIAADERVISLQEAVTGSITTL